MIPSRVIRLCCCLWLGSRVLAGAESWPEALAQMPLGAPVAQLTWSNAISLMLPAFRSNGVVKALIFMPGATDEFYLLRRAKAELTNASPSLLDAVSALTNETCLRAAFRPPLLLLYTKLDLLEPQIRVEDQATADKLKQARSLPHVLCIDRDWNFLEPLLHKHLRVGIQPWRGSRDWWHFYRPSFAAWNLDGWEALQAVALGSKTQITLRRKQAVFQLDRRSPQPPG